MTPEREAEIRSMCRCPDLFEVDNAYARRCIGEVLDELDRLRTAADGLEHYVTTRRDDIRDSLKSGLLEGPERWCAAREGATLTETLDKGRELGLWK